MNLCPGSALSSLIISSIFCTNFSFHFNPKKGNAKEGSNNHTVALISHTSKVILEFLQARLQQYMNQGLPDVQGGFRKGTRTRYQSAIICWIIENAGEFQKNVYSCFIDYATSFEYVDHKNCGKFIKSWEYQTILPASWETCMKVKKQQLEPTWNNGLVPNWERSMSKLYIVTLLILLMCRIHYVKCLAGWSTSWNQDCWEKYQ